jgi:AcrR family transcriptional regulator
MRPVPTSIAAKLPQAADLIADQGFDQTKIEELADVTGIPKATLYYYFSGKEEILVFLLRDLLTQVADAVAIALEDDGSALDRLRAVIRAQFEVMADQPSVWRALIADLGRAGRMPEIAGKVAEAYYAPVQQLLEAGAEDGSLRRVDDTPATAMAIFGSVTVVGLHYLMAGQPLDAGTLTRQVSELILQGVAA